MLIQAFGLDLGGSALVMRGLSIRHDNEKAGKRTIMVGGIIIGLTVLSLACVVTPNIFPDWTDIFKKADSALLLARVVGSAGYGFIIHLVKGMNDKSSSTQPQPGPGQIDLTAKIDEMTKVIEDLKTRISKQPVPEPIDYSRIDYSRIIEEVKASLTVPEPIDYSQIIDEIKAGLIVPELQVQDTHSILPTGIPSTPPATIQEEISVLKEGFSALLQSVPSVCDLDRNTQVDIPVVQIKSVREPVHFEGQNTQIYVPTNYSKRTEIKQVSEDKTEDKNVPGQPKISSSLGAKSVPPIRTKSVPAKTGKNPTETLLWQKYNEMIKKNMKVSGRSLAAYSGVNKNVACPWYVANIEYKKVSSPEDKIEVVNE